MGTIVSGDLLNRCLIVLNDDGTRFPKSPELLGWLNDGQREIASLKPSASTTTQVIKLQAGAAQSLPEGALELTRVLNYMGTDGTTPGGVIGFVDQTDLDDLQPGWQSATATDEPYEYTVNKDNPKTFFVNPPNTGNGYLKIITAQIPADVADTNKVINLGDEYGNALESYVLFKAFSKNAKGGDKAIAAIHQQDFADLLGIRRKSEVQAESPGAQS